MDDILVFVYNIQDFTHGCYFSYKIRIEALLLKEDFAKTMDWIKPSLFALIQTAIGKK